MVSEKLTKLGRTFTVIEPHHDDFGLSMLGTFLKLDRENALDELRIISCFSVGVGNSKTPTSNIAKMINATTSVIEMSYHNLMSNPKRDAEKYHTLHEAFNEMNMVDWHQAQQDIKKECIGQVLLPMGYCHPDHNWLSQLDIKDALFYREYPYFWHKGNSNYQQKYTKHLMKYRELELYETVELDELNYADWKWKIVPNLYKDVWGQFNPLFAMGRPWYKSVRDEALYAAK